MNKFLIILSCFVLISSSGCEAKKKYSVQEAITESQKRQSLQDQIDFLMNQAKTFLRNQEYDQVIAIGGYITDNLDKKSVEANFIMDLARKRKQNTAQLAK